MLSERVVTPNRLNLSRVIAPDSTAYAAGVMGILSAGEGVLANAMLGAFGNMLMSETATRKRNRPKTSGYRPPCRLCHSLMFRQRMPSSVKRSSLPALICPAFRRTWPAFWLKIGYAWWSPGNHCRCHREDGAMNGVRSQP